jgi:hypothetical protein
LLAGGVPPDALEFTVSVAGELVILPAELLTTTSNTAPLSAAVVAGVVYVGEVAPAMLAVFSRHWYWSGVVPVAATVKVAAVPCVTD